jgi:hypothetical protein
VSVVMAYLYLGVCQSSRGQNEKSVRPKFDRHFRREGLNVTPAVLLSVGDERVPQDSLAAVSGEDGEAALLGLYDRPHRTVVEDDHAGASREHLLPCPPRRVYGPYERLGRVSVYVQRGTSRSRTGAASGEVRHDGASGLRIEGGRRRHPKDESVLAPELDPVAGLDLFPPVLPPRFQRGRHGVNRT